MSDGGMELARRLGNIREIGLNGNALTEHDRTGEERAAMGLDQKAEVDRASRDITLVENAWDAFSANACSKLDELEAMVVGLKPAEGVSQDTLKNALVKNGLPWVDTTYAYQAVASEKRNLAEDAADDTNNRLSKVVTNIAAAWMDIEYRKSRVKAA